jgi:hypothetical protein
MNRLSEQVDILLEVAQQLSDSQAFGSIAALALVDQEYQDIVQPFLRHLKRKVVLDLAELQWFPKEGYPDIQYVPFPPHARHTDHPSRIIECTYVTGLPINPHIRNHGFATHLHDAGLRPWLITFYGRPHPFIATFRTAYFPHVSVVRVVERLGMVELQRIGAPYSTFGNTMVAHHLARGLWEIDAAPAPRREDADAGVGRCELRYRCHQDHELGFRADRPGQIWSRLEVVTRDGNRMRTTVWRVSEETTASGFIKDVMQEHPVSLFFFGSGRHADTRGSGNISVSHPEQDTAQ